MKAARVVILVSDTSSWPHDKCKVSGIYSQWYSCYRADTNMHKKHQRGDKSKVLNRELSFLYATHHHYLFYMTVKYYQNIPNGIQVIKWTRTCLRTGGRTCFSSVLKSGEQQEFLFHSLEDVALWMGSTLQVTNLLLEEQILSSKMTLLRRQAKKKKEKSQIFSSESISIYRTVKH